eukprot:CAMPEP_0170494786 /NCGR_PEP_ID=MMETSP0208-20121228/14836_1 /TAXON_ID=197538 /ORGANISM="Strombidium inclinatum, Strain S3" /LENGTH=38 /DNA_ID= /DNA_START= /DNA_END= /DNA_ORIENTATION=
MGEEPEGLPPKKKLDRRYDGDLVYEDDADIIEQSLGLD